METDRAARIAEARARFRAALENLATARVRHEAQTELERLTREGGGPVHSAASSREEEAAAPDAAARDPAGRTQPPGGGS